MQMGGVGQTSAKRHVGMRDSHHQSMATDKGKGIIWQRVQSVNAKLPE